MKITGSSVAVFAVIDTDMGKFRVWPDGAIDVWNDYFDDWDWAPFELDVYGEDDIKALREAAHDVIGNMYNHKSK